MESSTAEFLVEGTGVFALFPINQAKAERIACKFIRPGGTPTNGHTLVHMK